MDKIIKLAITHTPYIKWEGKKKGDKGKAYTEHVLYTYFIMLEYIILIHMSSYHRLYFTTVHKVVVDVCYFLHYRSHELP